MLLTREAGPLTSLTIRYCVRPVSSGRRSAVSFPGVKCGSLKPSRDGREGLELDGRPCDFPGGADPALPVAQARPAPRDGASPRQGCVSVMRRARVCVWVRFPLTLKPENRSILMKFSVPAGWQVQGQYMLAEEMLWHKGHYFNRKCQELTIIKIASIAFN